MQNDPMLMALRYVITQLKVRFAAVRSGELDRGALSVEWVVIAVGLVVAAGVVAAFVARYVRNNDSKITAP
jgi:hypothetical protein